MKSINAIIKKVTLDAEHYNCITLNLVLDVANGGGVSFGSVKLGDITPSDNARESDCQYMAWYISKVLQVVDVKSIDALVGKPVRAIFENKGNCGDSCIGLQHFLFDSIFFIPKYVNNPIIDFGGLFEYDENYKTVEELSQDPELHNSFRWMQTIEEGRKLINNNHNNQSNQ